MNHTNRQRPRICNRPWIEQATRIDLGCFPMIQRMVSNGLAIDRDALSDLSRFLDRDMERINRETESLLGRRVHLGSADQVCDLLFVTPIPAGGLQVHQNQY